MAVEKAFQSAGEAMRRYGRPARWASDSGSAARSDGAENGSAALIAALVDSGVEIFLCGQSAAAHGVDRDDLLPGVRMALSAMTQHALLQQRGYTLNPF